MLDTKAGEIPNCKRLDCNSLDLGNLKLSNGQNVRGLGVNTFVGNWDDLYSDYQGTTARSDTRFRNQMYDELRKIDPDTPIIFIGHSFGADSLMQVARCEAGNQSDCTIGYRNEIAVSYPEDDAGRQAAEENRKRRLQGRNILFLATLDPVMFGGVRMRRSVPSNVKNLFNRWTENSVLLGIPSLTIPAIPVGVGIPVDHGISGRLDFDEGTLGDSQEEQSSARTWDGQEKRVECGLLESGYSPSCSGFKAPTLIPLKKGKLGTRPEVLDHGEIANDHYIQRQIIEALTKLLTVSTPPSTPNSPVVKPPSQSNNPQNVPPSRQPVANNDTATVEPYGSVVINVLANDSGDGLKVTNVTNGSKGSASLNKDGTVTYSPNTAIFETTDKFTYTITDSKGRRTTATVTMTIR